MKRPSPALIVALLALFVALGGTGYAAMKINGKNIVKRSIPASKLKKNSLGGAQIKESKLGKVRSAARADRADTAGTADRATVAGNAERLGGRTAGSFASANLYTHRYTEATRDSVVTVFESGPFKVSLDCSPAFNGQDVARAGLKIDVSAESRNSFSNPGPDTLLPAGSTIFTGVTTTGHAGDPQFRQVAGYVDTADGRTLDISARLRVGTLGATWCSAVTQTTLGGS
jgi:hypothetical protein